MTLHEWQLSSLVPRPPSLVPCPQSFSKTHDAIAKEEKLNSTPLSSPFLETFTRLSDHHFMDRTIYINFFDGISPANVNKFIRFTVDAIQQHNPTGICFFISSNGGDVDSGFVLYNFLLSLQGRVEVTMHNTGTIDSIANVIFASGQHRYAAPNAAFLFHGVSMNFNGPQNRTALKESKSRLEGMELRIAQTLSRHSELTETELYGLFTQGQGKDVHFALEKAIIHGIKAPIVPPGAVHLVMTN